MTCDYSQLSHTVEDGSCQHAAVALWPAGAERCMRPQSGFAGETWGWNEQSLVEIE